MSTTPDPAPTLAPSPVAPEIPGPLAQPCRFGVYTGLELELQAADAVPTSARMGLEPPRFCGQCGRRMVVQVRPDGWGARCSRHGTVDSTELGQR
ncbi:hypothetical protein V1Y59_08590 [Gordonia sp. PKS22-38]|uniref:Biotin synthase auxiliary protein n=1 Tax=Gordonia prachuapensis TaxID=3115651 RepID=A0ABU7MT36_9ACTN|nr:hypothetical protein [Gordonia sp. PKS22-38]